MDTPLRLLPCRLKQKLPFLTAKNLGSATGVLRTITSLGAAVGWPCRTFAEDFRVSEHVPRVTSKIQGGPKVGIQYIVYEVSKNFGEWYQNTKQDTHKLTLFTFKIIAILHNALLASS